MSKNKQTKIHWLYQSQNRIKLWGIMIFVLLLLLIPEFFVHHHHNFEEQGIHVDASWGFYAWFAFFSCIAMVLLAKLMGIFLKRGEDYYDD